MIPIFLDQFKELTNHVGSAEYTLLTMFRKTDVALQHEQGFIDNGMDNINIRFQGSVVNVYTLQQGDLTLCYVRLDQCTLPLNNVTRVAGANMCGNIRHYFSINGYDYYRQLEDMELGDYAKFKYRYSLNKTREKITQFHHLHVRLRDLYTNKEFVNLSGAEAVLAMYLDRFNDIEATHATFLTYIKAAPAYAVKMLINLIRLNGGIDMEMLKREGTKCKQLQHYTQRDLTPIFELAVLVNRLETNVDWVQEKENRLHPTVVNIKFDKVKKHCKTLFAMAKGEGKKPMKMSWQDYWQQRAIMMPAGAVHSEVPGEKEVIRTLPRELKNKKGLSAVYTDLDISEFLLRPREINAYTSTKYEWGKVRALYGCDYTSHVHADFGLLMCEDTFPHFVPTGSAATEANVKGVLRRIENKVPFCYDYDDFNSQHSVDAMCAVIEAWIEVYEDVLTEDQILSAYWTLDSLHKMVVHNSYTNDCYEAKGTLFSGWRLTTFVNTALNYAYLAEAKINSNCAMSVHNGDDVYAGLDNLKQAANILNNSDEIGIRANKTKMSIGTIAEFLRIDMRATEKTSSQYLTRGISTFVHSRVESEAPLVFRSLVSSYQTRYNEVIARKAYHKPLKRLYRKQIFFARRLFDVDQETTNLLVETAQIAGGLKDNVTGVIGDYRLVDTTMPNSREGIGVEEVEKIVGNGVRSYTTYLCRIFPQISEHFKMRNVMKKTMDMFNITRKTVSREHASRCNLVSERAMRHAWRGARGISTINKMRMGIDNVLLAVQRVSMGKSAALMKADDPIRWISILT